MFPKALIIVLIFILISNKYVFELIKNHIKFFQNASNTIL